MKLTGDAEYSVAGRSIVIHENADDLGKDIDTKYYKHLGGGAYKGFLCAEVNLRPVRIGGGKVIQLFSFIICLPALATGIDVGQGINLGSGNSYQKE